MYVIKCKDYVETAPEGFPTWLLSRRWESFVVKYSTLDAALGAVTEQVTKAQAKPHPKRAYRVYEQVGRKLVLMWTLEPRD